MFFAPLRLISTNTTKMVSGLTCFRVKTTLSRPLSVTDHNKRLSCRRLTGIYFGHINFDFLLEYLEKKFEKTATCAAVLITSYLMVHENLENQDITRVWFGFEPKKFDKNQSTLFIELPGAPVIKGEFFSVPKNSPFPVENFQGIIPEKNWRSSSSTLNLQSSNKITDATALELLTLGRQNKIPEALKLFEVRNPVRFLLNAKKLEKSLYDIYFLDQTHEKPRYTTNFFDIPFLTQFLLPSFEESVWIVGSSAIGKSFFIQFFLWMKNIPFLKITTISGLKDFNKNYHKYLIFDDIDLSTLSQSELLAVLDMTDSKQLKIPYKTVELPATTKRIFLSNQALVHSCAGLEQVQRRFTQIDLKKFYLFARNSALNINKDKIITVASWDFDNSKRIFTEYQNVPHSLDLRKKD